MNKISVFSSSKKFCALERRVKIFALKILKILNKKDAVIEVFLVSDKEMLFLNKTFRKKNKPTNVLSFPEPKNFPHPELKSKKERYLGAIYLDIPYIEKETRLPARQAKTSLVDFDFLMLKLLIHGALHLLGFVHAKKNDRIKMEKKEQYVFNRLRHRNFKNKSNNS